jgi:sugar-specific transcriptional regulator TrmB
MVNMLSILQKIGLTNTESKVYLALIKTGEAKVAEISKESQINRTYTYDSLKKLLEKGLVSYVIEGNKKWFKAVDPERLIEFLKEKEEDVKSIIPQLKTLYKLPKSKHNVSLFYGFKGVKSVFQDMIREGKTNYVMDSEGQFADRMPWYAPHFVRQVEKNNIKIKHLVREGRDAKPSKTTEVRFISKKTKSEGVMTIFGNKLAIVIWSDVPECVLIENKAVADSFRDYFKMLWNSAKKNICQNNIKKLKKNK